MPRKPKDARLRQLGRLNHDDRGKAVPYHPNTSSALYRGGLSFDAHAIRTEHANIARKEREAAWADRTCTTGIDGDQPAGRWNIPRGER